jgi:hypothetical protein
MSLLDLLNQSKENAPKRRSESNEPRLKVIDMSRKGFKAQDGTDVPSNQGTIKILPVVSLTGQEVKYAYDIREYLYEGDEYNTKYRLMDPKDYDMDLSDDDKAKIMECRSLIEHADTDLEWGFPYVDSSKNYALIFGYVLEHTSIDDDAEITTKENRTAALLVFPSKNFAKALTSCLTKMQGYGDQIAEEMYNDLFSRNTVREDYLTITFQKSSGFGYDIEISADSFDRKCVKILTPDELKESKVSIPEDQMKFFTSQSAVFFAGNRRTIDDFEEGQEETYPDFDSEYCQKVIDQIKYYMDKEEKEGQEGSNLPPIPSKNTKEQSDLDK